MQVAPTTQQITAGNDEIMFRDIEKATINGFLGIAIHWLAVPGLILLLFVTYVTTITALFGGFLQLALVILWFLQWNS